MYISYSFMLAGLVALREVGKLPRFKERDIMF